jgi:hypothetical protein
MSAGIPDEFRDGFCVGTARLRATFVRDRDEGYPRNWNLPSSPCKFGAYKASQSNSPSAAANVGKFVVCKGLI